MRTLYRGWYVVAVCFGVAMFGWGLGFYGPGVYLLELRGRLGSTALVSVVTTFYLLCGAVLIMLLPAALRRWGPRPPILAGIACMAVSSVAVSLVGQLWQLAAVYVVMAVGWATMSSTAIATVLNPWFTRRRGLALSLALNGASCGGVVVVPALVGLTARLGFAGAADTVAAAMLVLLVPAVWAFLRRPPGADDRGHGKAPARRADLLRSRRFWSLAAPFALALAAQVGFLNHELSLLAPSLGAGAASLAVSLTTALAIAGRLALGLVIDRVDLRWAAGAVFALQVVGLSLLALRGTSSPAVAYLAVGIFGLSVGNVTTLPALLVQREFDPAAFAVVLSLSTSIGQLTYAFGPLLLGAIHDTTGGYTPVLAACITLELAAIAVAVLPRARRQG